MAINEVDMRMGTYPWPDGRPRVDKSGAPKVVRQELLRSVGLSVQYEARGKALFEDEWYKEQVALELARRQEAFKLETNKFYNEALETASYMLHEINLRVKNAPSSISFDTLCKYFPSILRIGIDLEARANADRDPATYKKPVNATQLFAQQLVYVDGESSSKIAEALADNTDKRKEEILTLVRAKNALEREIVDGSNDDDARTAVER